MSKIMRKGGIPMKCLSAFVLCCLLSAGAAIAADEAVFPRYPAPSPDGQFIAFSYQGDLWVVSAQGGRALRLTIHPAYDHHPVWSPDGAWIAFSSDRFGNDDVFVIPSTGGEAKRLTYMSVPDVVCDWTPDGSAVIFTSVRDYSAYGATRNPFVYSVQVAGGEPVKIMPETGNEIALSPDGAWIAYTSHSRSGWWRKGYRGSSNNNIWLWNRGSGEYKQVTSHGGNEGYPMWTGAGGALCYVGEESGVFNLWRTDLATGLTAQLTKHDDHIRFPAISRDGSRIAYELGTDLWLLDTAGGEPRKLVINAPSDNRVNDIQRLTMTNGAGEFAVSPDNADIAFVIRGEIFAMKEKGGTATRLTESWARDHDIAWRTDGTALAYVSDVEGQFDIYLVESDDPAEKRLSRALAFKQTRLTTDPGPDRRPVFSPDGKALAYVNGAGNLHILDLESKQDRILVSGWNMDSFSWSPDSAWIAYAKEDHEFNSDIWIIPAAGGTAVNISKHPDNDYNPVWSANGKVLAFVSRRLENNYDVWFTFLTKADDQKTAEDWEDEEEANKAPGGKPAAKPEEPAKKDDTKKNGVPAEQPKKEEPKLVVKIDFEDINLRLRKVVSLPGSEFGAVVSPDAKYFALVSDNSGTSELYSVKWDGTELKQLTNGNTRPSGITFSKDGKKLYFLRFGGMIQSVGVSGGAPTMHAFSARMTIDGPKERLQKFEDGWRALNEQFYDANFHGADWSALRDKYRPWAVAAVENRDFTDVFNIMLGHLNASHLAMMGGFGGPGGGEQTGFLGLFFDTSYTGPGLKVGEVLKDGPADRETSRIKAGQYIMAIDGMPVNMATNVSALLVDTVNAKVVLTVADAPDATETARIVIRPVSSQAMMGLLYERHIDQRREIVHRLSNNRVGYLHVQSMSGGPLERFEMELYSEAHDKDAIIIDVRDNGGGSTADLMLAMLQVREHAQTVARGGDRRGYPQDRRVFYAWTKPFVVMCNEYSFSNAEIFPWAIKTLGLAKVIGQQTFGAVISTGAYGLIDGSAVRTPGRGWYVMGSNINMENNGCPPDIVVEYQKGDAAKGIDRQLERAVQELLAQTGK
jgi:tricorn protease